MKKIFFTLLMIASAAAFGQTFTLKFQGNVVESGSTITLPVNVNAENDFYMDLTNNTAEAVQMRVYKNQGDMVEGSACTFCFCGGCFDGSQSGVITIQANESITHEANPDRAFHGTYTTLSTGVSTVEFVFANEDNFEDNVRVTFNFVAGTAVEEVAAIENSLRAYPNPASENVNIDYSYSGNAVDLSLVVKNLMGAVVTRIPVSCNSNHVSLNLSDFTSGIYFYSLEADGKAVMTKKLLVK